MEKKDLMWIIVGNPPSLNHKDILMQLFKSTILICMLGLCQYTLKAQTKSTGAKQILLEKIIFRIGGCYGGCNRMGLQIDRNCNILIIRHVYDSNGKVDERLTGNFKGKIDKRLYNNLIDTLIACDYANLKFPPEDCCDIPLITIIVYANGKRTKLSSIFPPDESKGLIYFLQDLGMKEPVPRTNDEIDLE